MKLVNHKQMRSIVVGYLRKSGYLTRGFVGDGPLRIEFTERKKNDHSVVVGVRESSGGSYPKHEIVAVKIDEGAKCEPDFIIPAADCGDDSSANKCFLAMPINFAEEDKKIAKQFGIGLLEIDGDKVKEVVPAKLMKSNVIAFPKHRFEGLKVVQHLLKFTEKDFEHLARVFCRAEVAWFGFTVGGVYVGFDKESGTLEVEMSVRAGPLRKVGTYHFKFGELAGFIVKGDDDRYTFVDKLGAMFVFRPSEWRFMLRVLSRVDMCFLVFKIGTARIAFSKHPGQDGLDLEMDFVDERDTCFEHHYSQKDLGMLTGKRRLKERQVIASSEES